MVDTRVGANRRKTLCEFPLEFNKGHIKGVSHWNVQRKLLIEYDSKTDSSDLAADQCRCVT